jgi:hypothetical protein
MAAISALLFACARVISEADILAAPGSYSETLELIETHARHLRLVQVKQGESQASCSSERPQILLFDSCVPAIIYDSLLNSTRPHLDLVVFDTTCFAASSGRIRHVLSWADRWQIPVVLVRSHTKLDSLGVEYGRLGSAAFVTSKGGSCASEDIKNLALEMRNSIRLFGGAALPAHFPPFVGGKRYRALTNRRIAGILRNSRRAARHFALTLSGSAAELHFVHGLYLTLASDRMSSEQQARQTASEMARDLSNAGLPLRHAGSFGFDFFATEWFHHAASDRYAVRLAIADLPTQLSDELVQAIAEWWSHYERSSSARKRFDECAHTGS